MGTSRKRRQGTDSANNHLSLHLPLGPDAAPLETGVALPACNDQHLQGKRGECQFLELLEVEKPGGWKETEAART